MSDGAPGLEILMATYNGERYLPAQLASLRAQSRQGFRLLVRDDGSTDGTPGLLAREARAPGLELRVVSDGEGRLGPAGNFAALLRHASAPYTMFCDQDDVWLPEKVERSLEALHALERRHGADVPLLVHTDLQVVDAELRPIAPSLWRQQRYPPGNAGVLRQLLVRNVVTGCTMAFNAPLRRLVTPVPPGVLMHDWWVALAAAAFGHVAHVDAPTVLYRQHGGNVLGARRRRLPAVFGGVAAARRAARYFARTRAQAALFLEVFGDRLPEPQRAAVAAYADPQGTPWIGRKRLLLRGGFLRSDAPLWNTLLLLLG